MDFAPTRNEKQWFNFKPRIEANVRRIVTLLAGRKQSATFFILGWIARNYPEVVKLISENGYDIGLHSNNHKLIYESNSYEFRQDIRYGKKLLEDLTGKPVISYRAPGFSFVESTSWTFRILLEENFEVDASIFPARRIHGGMLTFPFNRPCRIDLDGAFIKEFPINPVTFLGYPVVYSGGGYFRFWPYSLIKRFTNQSKYVMSYFHPRDFDPAQPVLSGLSPIRHFMSYTGLKSSFKKFEQWITDFQFVDVKTAKKQISWNNTPTYKF